MAECLDDVQIGSRIRAYNRPDRAMVGIGSGYMEGKVTGFMTCGGITSIVYKPDTHVYLGDPAPVPAELCSIPANGQLTLRNRVTNHVELLQP